MSFLYRYIPRVKPRKPGDLQKGGKLQVLTLEQLDDFNVDLASPRQQFGVVWKNVNPEEPHESAEDVHAARFGRLEGAHFSGGAFWFDDTIGGEQRLGQIFRLIPGGGSGNTGDVLELFYEGTEPGKMQRARTISS